MAEIKQLVCDICQDKATTTWSIGQRGRKPVVVDLCNVHAQPLDHMLQAGRSGEGSSRPYRKIQKVTATPL